ncbi:glycosyltransferase family 2 protein [Candidatus Woesebacteria bacterium]|nr:glycosyltransferase family 2 protein [Candidatus Woesebacteria bacterium]
MPYGIVRSKHFYRFGEMIIPLLTWLIILLPIWLSPFHPAVVAYFIIVFDLYFLIKSFRTSYYATKSFMFLNKYRNVDFRKQIIEHKKSKDIQHFVIIPNYKEPLHKLHDTIRAMTKSDYPYKQIYLVLAFEKREKDAMKKEREIKKIWGKYFKDVISTFHVLKEGEIIGKASNQAYAGRVVDTYCTKHKLDSKQVLITICDADSILPKNYFSYLTDTFIHDQGRDYHFYWAPVLLYNNFWQLPFMVRMQSTLSSILRIASLSEKEKLIQVSTYSTNLWLLKQVDFWDVDIIPEDWHIYFQAFFTFGEKVQTMPLYTIVNSDAVYAGSVQKTLINRYEQEKRWAWGVTDIAYSWKHLFITPHISWSAKLKKFLYICETHLFWPTSFFILTISGYIPPLINPVFNRTVLGFILPRTTSLILTLATVVIVLYIYVDISLRKKMNIKTSLLNLPLVVIQWYFLPIVSFIFSSLPALDAHTRLLFGKKIEYKVTEKV